jgi:5'-nucleotidase (lipoprotein e(P4) family)
VGVLTPLFLISCAKAPPIQPIATAPPSTPTSGMQWLYGSAEGAASGLQTYRMFRDYALKAAKSSRRSGVVLVSGAIAEAPAFVPCGKKAPAVILDVDETVLQNLGVMRGFAEAGKDFDPVTWARWERSGAGKAAAIPGAVAALKELRKAGIAVIFNTNRSRQNAAGSEATLIAEGAGPAKHLDTLFLMGDIDGVSGKDGRRAHIAARYCVVAMAGDQMGDFWDKFNTKELSVRDRRTMAISGSIASLWGNGWFLLPNPVYGPSIKGGFDDVFAPDKKWADPG